MYIYITDEKLERVPISTNASEIAALQLKMLEY